MDWLSWLSKTNLDPSLIPEYAYIFVDNELDEDDIAYFSHDFLQSMGISKAKHRLEILKLARKQRSKHFLWMASALARTKAFFMNRIRALTHRENSALSVVPMRNHSLRWKLTMMQRKQRFWSRNENNSAPRMLMMAKSGQNDVDSGSSHRSTLPESEVIEPGEAPTTSYLDSSMSSKVVQSPEREYFSGGLEQVKWDSMFQDLKPT